MLTEYVQEALNRAHYEMIADEEPFYGEIPELEGVWATGGTLEECRARLAEVVEDWLLLSIAKGLPIPPLGHASIRLACPRRQPANRCRLYHPSVAAS